MIRLEYDTDMPVNCWDCMFLNDEMITCVADVKQRECEKPGHGRQEWCPLKEVKTDEPDQDCADCELSEIEKMNGGCQLCRAR